jgi:phosphoribosyl-ATP pyrophosphohydrolase/phosphoribosyl-AMP cyclohydrolase
LTKLANVIEDRRLNPTEESYTSSLFKKGINKIAQKVGEEAVELVIEAKDDNDDLFKNEAADLLYHLLVLLEAKQISLSEVIKTLKKRH